MTPISRCGAVALCVLTVACGAGRPKPLPAPPPVLVPVEVVVPVATGCVPANMAEAPDYPDSDEALKSAPGPDARYQLLYAGRKLRQARLGELEPVIAGCPKAAPK